MSVTVYSEIVYPTHVRRRYAVVLMDNLGGVHEFVRGMYNDQPSDTGDHVEVDVIAEVKDQEIQQWISEMESGNDPAHIDMGGWFEHSELLWNTWEECLAGSLTPILQSDYMQDILNCELTCSRLTNRELEAIAGKPNNVLAEQAVASNTQTELDNYVPLINENGEPR